MLLALAVLLTAQAPPPPPPPAPDRSGSEAPVSDDLDAADVPRAADTLRARAVPPRLGTFRADPDFQYDTPQARGPSLWDRLLRWLSETFLAPIVQNTTWGFWKTVLVGLALAALGWVAARLLSAEGSRAFGRSPAVGAGPLLDVEDIAEVDLDARLGAALGRGDLREAVRVRYLLVLQALDGARALAWRRDKTNRQYVAEVSAARADLAEPFGAVTRAFDAVWYGERAVSEALYGRLETLFDRAAP